MRTRSISSTARFLASFFDIPRCARNISPIWKPTLYTGFSADRASWKIIEMPGPRILRCSASSMVSRSRPSKRMPPPVMTAGGESRMPMIAWAETDLPDPDSPRIARVSPSASV